MAETETGIDITNYTAERDSGIVAIRKGAPNSGNYIYVRTTYAVQLVNGVPTAVETSTPKLANINLQSIADIRAMLDREAGIIAARRLQLDAIEADMNSLDSAL